VEYQHLNLRASLRACFKRCGRQVLGILTLGIILLECALVFTLPAQAQFSTPGKPLPPEKPLTLTVATRKRAYVMTRPAATLQHPAPVLLVLHGDRAGRKDRGLRDAGFDTLAQQDGLVVVYPQAAEHQWNDGRPFTGRFMETGRVDDTGFLRALVDKLVADKIADPRRVFVTGMGTGGMMAFRLACEMGDRLAGIAPVLALPPEGLPAPCPTAQPLPLLLIVASEDQFIPLQGGSVMPFLGDDRGRVLSLEQTVRSWRTRNRCRGLVAQRRWLPDSDAFDQMRVQHSVWSPCDTPVALYEVRGGGHQWPGQPATSSHRYAGRFLGRGTMDLDGTAVIWGFFRGIK
jgi:polyhydroxybutyrate depolymerase